MAAAPTAVALGATTNSAAKRNPEEPSMIRLWPPGDRTRAHVTGRMSENLRALSQHYTPLQESEAAQLASQLEELAFQDAEREIAAAGAASSNGSSAVRVYAKQASKLMLETLKAGGKVEKSPIVDAKSQASTVSQDVDISVASTKHTNGHTAQGTAKGHGDTAQDTVVDGMVFDISGGIRDVLEEDKAAELFRPLENGSYTQIRLSDWAFTRAAAEVAAAAISNVKDRITKADLSDIVAGRPEPEALEVMVILSRALEGANLNFLDLSNNALGEKGVRAFGALLKSQHHLKELFFVNNGISHDAARAIVELLPSSRDLKVLHFHNNMSGGAGATILGKLIEKATGLEDFRFSSSRVDGKGGVALADALKAGSSLRKLDLRDNMFGSKAGVALAGALKHHKFIKELYLGDLGMRNAAVMMLLDAIGDAAPNVSVLDLGNNGITWDAAGHVAKAVGKMTCLKKLGLQENAIKDKGVVMVAQALEGGHEELEEVDFTQTGCKGDGAVAAAKAVANKPGFKKLILESNHISEEALGMVESVLEDGVGSEVLVPIEDNNVDEEDEDDDEEEEEYEDDEDAQEEDTGDSEELQARLGGLSV